jgi:hypothetical protein
MIDKSLHFYVLFGTNWFARLAMLAYHFNLKLKQIDKKRMILQMGCQISCLAAVKIMFF